MSRQSRGFNKMKMTAHVKFMRGLGYKSLIFRAKYAGGRCGLSGQSIAQGADVAFFRDHGLCLEIQIRQVLEAERLANAPKCSCGNEATLEVDAHGVAQACIVCHVVAAIWFDQPAVDVIRETPLAR